MEEKRTFELSFMGKPATPFPAEFVEGNIAPPPTTSETLRAIADSVSSNDDAVKLVFAGILRKAADELDAKDRRIAELIDAMPT